MLDKYYNHRLSLDIDLVSEIMESPSVDNIERKLKKASDFLSFLKKEESLLKEAMTSIKSLEEAYVLDSYKKLNQTSQESCTDLIDMLTQLKF